MEIDILLYSVQLVACGDVSITHDTCPSMEDTKLCQYSWKLSNVRISVFCHCEI